MIYCCTSIKLADLTGDSLTKKKERKKEWSHSKQPRQKYPDFQCMHGVWVELLKKQQPYNHHTVTQSRLLFDAPPPRATEDIIQFSQTKGVSMPEVSDNSTWSPLPHTFLIAEFEGAASDIFLLQEVKVSRASLSSSPLFILYTVVCSVCTNVCDTLRDCLKVCTIISVAWLQTFEGAYSAELPDSLCNKLTSSVWYQAIESIYLLE